MIQSGLRRAVAASAAQAGDGDWIINLIPAYRQAGLRELNHRRVQDTLIQLWIRVLKGQEAFYLAGISPPNKKYLLRALCDSVVENL